MYRFDSCKEDPVAYRDAIYKIAEMVGCSHERNLFSRVYADMMFITVNITKIVTLTRVTWWQISI